MKDKDPVVKGIEKILELLPDELNDTEKEKVTEIRELLQKIDYNNEEREETIRDDR